MMTKQELIDRYDDAKQALNRAYMGGDQDEIRSATQAYCKAHDELYSYKEPAEEKRYIVSYEFLNPIGVWVLDDMTNNGEGFSLEDANALATEFNSAKDDTAIQTRKAWIVEMRNR